MKVIIGSPSSGKTKALLLESEAKQVPILAENEARVDRLLFKARGYGIKIPVPVTVSQLDGSIKEVLIDDISRLFEVAFNVKVGAITANRDESIDVIDLDQ